MAALQYSVVIPMRFATAPTLNNFLPYANCAEPLCSQITSSSPDVYTSDFQAAYWWQVMNAAVGETIAVNATDPNGKPHTYLQLTYSGSISGCYQGTGWTDNFGDTFCDPAGFGDFVTGINVTCGPVGAWTLGLYDNGNPTPYSVPFNLVHSDTSLLGITAPSDDEIFDLDQQNYISTDSVPFSAGTVTGNPITWAVTVNYATSGGYGRFSNTLPGFQTAGGATQNQTFQSEGGQVHVTASTTASDGSAVQDCVTFYIDGVQAGIPNASITSQLNALYQSSSSYPTDPTGQYPPTPNLMTGVAKVESSYEQFQYPGDGPAPGEPDLYPAVYAKWPYESPGGGKYIGLMQLATTPTDAWDWTKNTTDAVNLFSGTTSPNKIQLASTYANDIIGGDPKNNIDGYYELSPLVGSRLENMALTLYGGWLINLGCGTTPSQTCLQSQYYIPSCSGTQGTTKQKGQTYLTCSTGWQWAPNTANQPGGINYVANLRNSTLPQ